MIMTLIKKVEMIYYLNKRDKRIKFHKSDEKSTSLLARKKAGQLLWKIKAKYLPILQSTSYCYSFVRAFLLLAHTGVILSW